MKKTTAKTTAKTTLVKGCTIQAYTEYQLYAAHEDGWEFEDNFKTMAKALKYAVNYSKLGGPWLVVTINFPAI